MNIIDILGTIGFDWQVASVNLVSFLIIYWILKKFVFDHVKNLIKERREKIAAGLDQADQAAVTLSQAEEDARQVAKQAQLDAHGLISDAKERAESVSAKVLTDAQSQAEQIIASAHTRGEQDIATMRDELTSEMVDVVVAAVSKIAHEDMTPQKQQALLDRAAKLITQS